jgi:hypothetical protein
VLEVTFAYIGKIGIDTGLYECGACGALVAAGRERQHVAFHARIAGLERADAGA